MNDKLVFPGKIELTLARLFRYDFLEDFPLGVRIAALNPAGVFIQYRTVKEMPVAKDEIKGLLSTRPVSAQHGIPQPVLRAVSLECVYGFNFHWMITSPVRSLT
jgi:hypothetical protein